MHAADPTSEPLLRLDTGMHTAPIRRIATDRSGRWAVTASFDKTARVWEVASGRLLAVVRPPQDKGNEGRLDAVAMSPDGRVVALAGWTSGTSDPESIYLFDRASARLMRRIDGLSNVVLHLDFSPDGRWLAAGLFGNNGIRLFEVTSGAERGRDAGYGSDSYSVHFDSDSRRLVSTSYDGQLRTYAVNEGGSLRPLKASGLAGGKRPFAARFSPDGRRIAVGFDDSRIVQVLDAQTLSEVERPSTVGVDNGNLLAVAWSADGRSLLAGGQWQRSSERLVRRWAADDGSRHEDIVVSRDTVVNLVAPPAAAGGGWLFAAADPAWGVLDASGRVLRRQDPAIADLRDQVAALHISADGRRVRFGYLPFGKEPHVFDLGTRTLQPEAAAAASALQPARTDGLKITDWKNDPEPKLDGKPLALDPYERSRSLAIAPDGRRFVLGTDWSLRLFDAGGRQLWRQPVPGTAWAVNISADGRHVIAAYGDGTIRWHRLDDGREILALFPHADRKRWVAWTPEGYFDASPGAEALVGYHLNHGRDREGEFVSARQLWEAFYQPALIARRLDANGDQLLAEQVQRRGDVRGLLKAGSVPELELASPAQAQSSGSYELAVRIRNAGQGGGKLVVRVDDVELAGRWNAPALTPGRVVSMPVDLAEGVRRLTVELVDARGIASKPVAARIDVRKPANTPGPTLHVLAVGVTRYRDQALARGVAFAADDAHAVAAAFQRGSGGLYTRVLPNVLPDDQATRDGIEAAARRLATEVKPEDTVVVYFAGHGVTANGDYHYLPWETRYTNFDALVSQALSADRLRELLAAINARKVLVLLDTCSAGRFSLVKGREIDDKASIDRFQRVTGRAVIAAAADEKMALEGEGGHGVFTFALLAALQGAADRDRDGFVSVSEAAQHIDEHVPAITKRKWGYEQFPMMETRGSVFPLVRRGP